MYPLIHTKDWQVVDNKMKTQHIIIMLGFQILFLIAFVLILYYQSILSNE